MSRRRRGQRRLDEPHLVERARESITATGEPLDDNVFKHLASKLSYVQGDLTEPATYGRIAAEAARSTMRPLAASDPALLDMCHQEHIPVVVLSG